MKSVLHSFDMSCIEDFIVNGDHPKLPFSEVVCSSTSLEVIHKQMKLKRFSKTSPFKINPTLPKSQARVKQNSSNKRSSVTSNSRLRTLESPISRMMTNPVKTPRDINLPTYSFGYTAKGDS